MAIIGNGGNYWYSNKDKALRHFEYQLRACKTDRVIDALRAHKEIPQDLIESCVKQVVEENK